jgi:type II secretory pathway pseudopilin PulG
MGRTTRGSRSSQRGETLLELLVAMSILGTGVVALVGGIGTSVLMSDVHRKQATAGAAVRTFAEAIETGVSTGTSDPYVPCAKPSDYDSPAGFSRPEKFSAVVADVAYWSPAERQFVSTCKSDSGVQRLLLVVTSSDARAKEQVDVVVRRPCLTDTSCGA